MPRRKKIVAREILPDPKFGDLQAAKFMNNVLKKGKKGVAEKIFYNALDIIEHQTKGNGLELFHKAIRNVSPVMEVKSKRIGGATYQVPMEVRTNRKFALATRWILRYAKLRPGKSMADKLAAELIAASNNEGGSIKKRDDTHKMAEANKAFAHFR